MNVELGLSHWWPLAGVLGVASAALVVGGYRRQLGRVPPAGWLKLAGLWLLIWWLLEPLHVIRCAPPQANVMLVLVDDSRSMQARTLQGRSPADALRTLLSADGGARAARRTGRGLGSRGAANGPANTAAANDRPPRFDERLAEHFRVRRFAAGKRLRPLADYRSLGFTDGRSPLRRHLHDLAAAFRGQPIGGILLFSDGADSELPDTVTSHPADTAGPRADVPAENAEATEAPGTRTAALPPVYAVRLGRPTQRPNVAVVDARVTETLFEDAPVTLSVDILAQRASGRSVRAAVFDAAGKLIEQRLVPIANDPSRLELLFRLSETVRRTAFARVQVGLADEWRPRQTPPRGDEAEQPDGKDTPDHADADSARATASSAHPVDHASSSAPAGVARPATTAGALHEATYVTDEITLADNDLAVALRPETRRHRILYVAGRPNWEWKFVRRSLETDRHLQLTGLIRIARREARFDFRGRRGQRSNALFRGFDTAEDEAEQYDQPVFLRLNTADADELRGGFPVTAEQLFGFEAVILDDIEAAFFTRQQLALLQRFVSERGGSLLMLGGIDSFRHGGYHKTVLADVLPVYMDAPVPSLSAADADHAPETAARAATRGPHAAAGGRPHRNGGNLSVHLRKTRQGRVEPWLRLCESLEDDARREQRIPAFHVVTPARTIKPAAVELARFETPAGHPVGPALVAQRFGRGRAVAFLGGDLWRWRMKSPAESADCERFWRQLARWLVAEVPPAHQLTLDRPTHDAHALRCLVQCRDRAFAPDDRAEVRIDVFCSEPDDSGTTTGVHNAVLAAWHTADTHGGTDDSRATVHDAGFTDANVATDAGRDARDTARNEPDAASTPPSDLRPRPPGRWRKLCTLTAQPVDERPGTYEARFRPPREALLWVVARIRPGEHAETSAPQNAPIVLQTGWGEQPRHAEFRALASNPEARLRKLAEDTGGAVVPAEDLESFVRELPRREMPIQQTRREPLWHSPWMLLAALTCTIGEWFWRRRSGLA